jgi:hypothetical protein
LKLFVSSVPAGRFLEVLFAGIVQQKTSADLSVDGDSVAVAPLQ